MITFKISEEVQRRIEKIDPHCRIVGHWTGIISITNKEDLTSLSIVNLLKKMFEISGRPSRLLISDMKRIQTNDYATWVADTEDFDSWLDNLQVIDDSIESTLADYHFDVCLEGKQKYIIKDGASFLLTADDYPTSTISLSLWMNINVFSERIWAGFNEALDQPNKLLLGEECANYNRNVLANTLEKIQRDLGIEQPFTFESENMSGACATGFENGCSQFRF